MIGGVLVGWEGEEGLWRERRGGWDGIDVGRKGGRTRPMTDGVTGTSHTGIQH